MYTVCSMDIIAPAPFVVMLAHIIALVLDVSCGRLAVPHQHVVSHPYRHPSGTGP